MLFSGLDLIYNEEQGKHLEDEKRLLQSQVNLERRKLEAESERLRLEAMKLEAERAKFEEERKRLASKTMSEDSTTSTTSADTTSLESSSSTSGNDFFLCTLCSNRTFKICIPSLNSKLYVLRRVQNINTCDTDTMRRIISAEGIFFFCLN